MLTRVLIMALAANALTTLAIVKTELGITGATEDTYLERMINAASDRIENYCSRAFFKETGKIENVAGFGGVYLLVSKAPLLAITSITFDGNTVASADYEIHDADVGSIYRKGGWHWTTARLKDITQPPMPGHERKLYKVTYDGGYETPEQGGTRTLPFDLEDACVQMVASRFRGKGRDPNIKSEKLLSWSATYGASELPSSVTSILNRHRLHAAA